MADIELVIKIDEKMYKDIQSRDWKNGAKWFSEEWRAIHNGTPLPEGHGKIGDIDRLQEVFRRNVVGADAYKQLFDDAPTIIEADKENK